MKVIIEMVGEIAQVTVVTDDGQELQATVEKAHHRIEATGQVMRAEIQGKTVRSDFRVNVPFDPSNL